MRLRLIAASLALILILSGCEVSVAPSKIEEARTEQNVSIEEDLLTLDEINAVFADLDSKYEKLLYWLNQNYTQIPIEGVPTHEIEALVGVGGISTSEGDGTYGIYGPVLYAKVTSETIPDFPWQSVDEINEACSEIFYDREAATNSPIGGLTNQGSLSGPLFLQFEDGLYFRTTWDYFNWRHENDWDYSTTEIWENKSDLITVHMEDQGRRRRRYLKKKEDGSWKILVHDADPY